MNPFAKMKSDDLEKSEDRLGGGFRRLDTDIYTGTIKMFYAGQSQGGAHNVTVVVAIGDTEYRETIYVSNKKGENWFPAKDSNGNATGKKQPLPGFTIVNDICLATVGKELSEIVFEEKTVKLWDRDARQELPKAVPMAVELLGQEITLAIHKNLEDKTKDDGNGNYVPTGDTQETNTIDKVFNTATKMTVNEAMAEETEPKFHDAWLDRNKGKVRDKTAANDNAGTAGRPGNGNNAGAPTANAAAGGARKKLFG